MAIKGISDVDRFPRIGKIRLGLKDKDRGFPVKTDYFVFDPDDDAVKQEFSDIYGEKPKALDIMFASEDLDSVFPQYLKRYAFGSLICKGDGEKGIEKKYDENKKLIGEQSVKCEGCKYSKDTVGKNGKKISKKCKPLASLMILLPKVPGIGVYQLDTSSYHSIVNINAGIKLVKALYKRISGIPLKLLLSPRTVQVEGRATIIYTISLSIEGTLQDALKSGTVTMIEPKSAILPPPDEEDLEDHFQDEDQLGEGEKTVDRARLIALLKSQASDLGYKNEVMTLYIQNVFKKSKATELSDDELLEATVHLDRVLQMIEIGLLIYSREEMEDWAKKFYKSNSLIELNDGELKKYERLIEKSTPLVEE